MGQHSSYYLYQKYERRCTACTEADWVPCYPNTYSISGDSTTPLPLSCKTEYDVACGYIPKGSDDYNYEKWEVVDGYICDDTTKYARERKYVSDDNVNWTATDIYRRSTTVLAYSSTDCGYDPQWDNYNCSKWEVVSNDYICNEGNKYQKLRKYVRQCENCDSCSSSWSVTNIYKQGDIITYDSTDCGYVIGERMYRWINLDPSTEYYCSDCPIIPLYRWVNLDIATNYICSNHNKYYRQQKQVSYDDGETWENVSPPLYQKGEVYEYNSSDCQSGEISSALTTASGGKILMYDINNDRLVINEETWNLGNYPLNLYYPIAVSIGNGEYCALKSGSLEYEDGVLRGISRVNYSDWVWGYVYDNWNATSCTISMFESADDWKTWADMSLPLKSRKPINFQIFKGADAYATFGTSRGDWKMPSVEQLFAVTNYGSIYETIRNIDYRLCDVLVGSNSAYIIPSWYQGRSSNNISAGNLCGFALGQVVCGANSGLAQVTNLWLDSSCSADTSVIYNEESGHTSHTLLPVLKITSDSYKGDETIDVNGYKAICGSKTIPQNVFRNTLTTKDVTNVMPLSSATSYTLSDEIKILSGTGAYGTSLFNYVSGHVDTNKVDTIMGGAFHSAHNITSINFNFSKYYYDDGLGWNFEGCTKLSSITINGVSSVGDIAIPSNITSIPNDCFNNCWSIRNITIPNTITSIGENAFYVCKGLTSCTIGSGVKTIGGYAFDACSALTSISIPSSVTSIGKAAFTGCKGLTSINIPTGVTSINDGTFWGCYSLTSIDIPSNVTSIGKNAIYNCSGLTSCTIGNGVTSIGSDAFYGCSSLTSVTVNRTIPPTLGLRAFDNTNNCPIYVPSASVNAYKSASGWSDYDSRIQGI